MINLEDARELDRAYERETDRLIEEHFGTQRKSAHVIEALKDVEIALKHLRKCGEWLNEACTEDAPEALEYRIGSYVDQVDELRVNLSYDLEEWGKRSW